MKKTAKKFDRSSAKYLERLAIKAARAYAPAILKDAKTFGLSLPLADADLSTLLHNTISGLDYQGHFDWNDLPTELRDVFIGAWADEMDRLGIRR